ncbi:MAG: hypothetical protein JWN62_4079, partial [Acidimicrobiales bacterium]|nr:hypothetical protein [Acidimicrobiales bacterium]
LDPTDPYPHGYVVNDAWGTAMIIDQHGTTNLGNTFGVPER